MERKPAVRNRGASKRVGSGGWLAVARVADTDGSKNETKAAAISDSLLRGSRRRTESLFFRSMVSPRASSSQRVRLLSDVRSTPLHSHFSRPANVTGETRAARGRRLSSSDNAPSSGSPTLEIAGPVSALSLPSGWALSSFSQRDKRKVRALQCHVDDTDQRREELIGRPIALDAELHSCRVFFIERKVDQRKMEEKLMEEGTAKFADPQKALLKLISEKRASLAAAK